LTSVGIIQTWALSCCLFQDNDDDDSNDDIDDGNDINLVVHECLLEILHNKLC